MKHKNFGALQIVMLSYDDLEHLLTYFTWSHFYGCKALESSSILRSISYPTIGTVV